MKKLFTLSILVFCFFTQAQNTDFIISLEKLDNNGVRKFADEIANNSKTKWEFLKIKEDEKKGYYRVIYLDATFSFELKEKIKTGKETCSNCLIVDFHSFFQGENKALEIPGIKKYRFSEVSGKYLDVFPTWKLYFKKDVAMEETLTNYKNKELVDKTIGIQYVLSGQDEYWTIHNHSNMFEYFKTHP